MKGVRGSYPFFRNSTLAALQPRISTTHERLRKRVIAALATTLWPATRILDRDRYGLQWRLDQTQRNTDVMKPCLQFVFHISPLGSLWRLEFCCRFIQIIVLTPTRCLLKTHEL